ncbi:MAG: polyphenol oxidase family protein [Longimicrobiales bacterium]
MSVADVASPSVIPRLAVPAFEAEQPWLTAGITWRGDGEPADMGLFGATPVGIALGRWRQLRADLGCDAILHSRQVHGTAILRHGLHPVPPGFHLAPDADGHLTAQTGLAVTVSVADCVPVWIVAPAARTVMLLHAGWRGTAAGILETGLSQLVTEANAIPDSLKVHLGPAICGRCYEVGPEVHEALGRPVPRAPAPIDLRQVLFDRAVAAGVPDRHVTASSLCTRCDRDRFFSHRAGASGRQVAFACIRSLAG